MTPEIIDIPGRKLLGLRIQTSNAENSTIPLWKQFKPRVREIDRGSFHGYYSVQIFTGELSLATFNEHTPFEKWAAVEVEDFEAIPDGFEPCSIPGGTYAVFTHVGNAMAAQAALGSIYMNWLPNSGFKLDTRPHFQVMAEDYQPNDPNVKEAFWIPVKSKH